MAKTKTKPTPKVIRRLLLVRKAQTSPDLVEKAGMLTYLVGEALKVSPKAWAEEQGLSHYGWKLEGMKLTALGDLIKWTEQPENHANTLLDLNEEGDVDAALDTVGLRINELAD